MGDGDLNMGMVDISKKDVIERIAEAEGQLHLLPDTIEKIRQGEIQKGDPFKVAEIAGMLSVKKTHLLIPHCHPLPIESVRFDFQLSDSYVIVRCTVKARAKTGVEMEALVGVSMALNTIWDMVKYLEKDEEGQYPTTKITDIRVIRKVKGSIEWQKLREERIS